jgi:hypothetical protein
LYTQNLSATLALSVLKISILSKQDLRRHRIAL